MATLRELLQRVTPSQALAEIAGALKDLLPLVTEADRLDFVVNLVGSAGDDKVASMVHL
jgi:hypothetical protein